MSTGNTKAQEVISTISAESVLISVESNWIQTKPVIWFIWFVLFVLLNQTNRRQSRAVICQQDAEKVGQPGSAER
jgi:hypothetical protein